MAAARADNQGVVPAFRGVSVPGGARGHAGLTNGSGPSGPDQAAAALLCAGQATRARRRGAARLKQDGAASRARRSLLHVACFFVAVAPLFPRCSAALTCSNSDTVTCGALSDLYTATSGASWSGKTGWSSAALSQATDYCQFAGVTCSGQVVSQLCVQSARTHVRVSPARSAEAAGTLNFFARRNFKFFQLSGSIPSTLGNLTGLTYLCVPPATRTVRVTSAQRRGAPHVVFAGTLLATISAAASRIP